MRGFDLGVYKQTLVEEGFEPNNTWPEIRRNIKADVKAYKVCE